MVHIIDRRCLLLFIPVTHYNYKSFSLKLSIQKIRLFNIVMMYCYNFAVKINRLGFSRILPSRNGIQC